jgi:NADPH-dependent ferric siderophore reductase
MMRIVFDGEDLADFISLGADDHVKMFFPTNTGEIERRDYTPRYFDREKRLLTIDFAIHEAGPATRWAVGAKPGDRLEIGGPKASTVVSPTFDWWLLVGDETALPSIARRIEELPKDAKIISVCTVEGSEEELQFATKTSCVSIWVHREAARADDPAPLIAALQTITIPDGDGYVWIAAEARVARAARDYFVKSRNHPLEWMKASGYWVKGRADAHDKLKD